MSDPTIVQGPYLASSVDAGSTLTRALTTDVTFGNVIVVLARQAQTDTGPATITASDNLGNTYTQALASSTTGNQRCYILTAPVTVEGSCTVTVNFGQVVQRREVVALEANNLDTSDLVEDTTTNTGTSTTPTAGDLDVAGPALLLGSMITDGGYSTTGVGASWTSITPAALWNGSRMGYRIVSSSGTYSVPFTNTSSQGYAAIGVALRGGDPPVLYGFDLDTIIFGNLVGSPVGIGKYPATEMHMQVRAVDLAGTIIATDTVTTDGDAKLARWTDASITLGTWYRIDLATTETDPGDRSTFSVLMQAT